MKNTNKKPFNRIFAFVLSALVMLSAFPIVNMYSMALETGDDAEITENLTTTLGDVLIKTGEVINFTVTTSPKAEDTDKTVLGSFVVTDDKNQAVSDDAYILKYKDSATQEMIEFNGDFGPATGFPLREATSEFSVEFKDAGVYNVKIFIKDVDTSEEIYSIDKKINVFGSCVLTSTIDKVSFVETREAEFTYSIVANGDAAKKVNAFFDITDSEGNALNGYTLSYYDTDLEEWIEITDKTFGPEGGFDLHDAETKFKAKFDTAGTYNVAATIKTQDNVVLCELASSVSVLKKSEIKNILPEDGETIYNSVYDFQVESIANGDAETIVIGAFELKEKVGEELIDATDAIEEIQYLNVATGEYEAFVGDTFGPSEGFKLANATSSFKVRFNRTGTFVFKSYLRTLGEDYEIICESTEDEIVVYPAEIEGIKLEAAENVVFKETEKEDDVYTINDLLTIDGLEDGDEVFYRLGSENESEDNGEYIAAGDFSLPVTYDEASKTYYVAAGTYNVYVKVKRAYHNDYVTFPQPISLTVNKADLPEDAVVITPYEGIYNGEKHNICESISVNFKNIKDYTFTCDDKAITEVEVDEVSDSGEYKVIVYLNDNYNTREISVNVNITPAEVEVGLSEDNEYDIFFNQNNKFKAGIDILTKTPVTGFNTDDIDLDYTITGEGAEINNSGLVTYTSIGEYPVSIKASTTNNNYKIVYKSDVDTGLNYTLNITNIVPENVYEIVAGEDVAAAEVGDVKYFSGEFSVVPAEGWVIVEKTADEQNILSSVWSDVITKSAEGDYELQVAFMDQDGNITSWISIEKCVIDTTAPQEASFKINVPSTLEKTLNFLTFGIFGNSQIEVTVTSADSEDNSTPSGTKTITLIVNGNEFETKEADDNNNATFVVPAEAFDDNNETRVDIALKAEITDRVGNKTIIDATADNIEGASEVELIDNKIMLENIKPVFVDIPTITNKENVSCVNVEGTTYYNGDFDLSFTVNDADSGLYLIEVYLNEKKVRTYNGFDRETKNEDYPVIISSSENDIVPDDYGMYEFVIKVTDCSGNVSEKSIVVYSDETAPIISEFEFYKYDVNDEAILNEATRDENTDVIVNVDHYGFYFNETVKVKITATDIASLNETFCGVKAIAYKLVNYDGSIYREDIVDVTEDGVKKSASIVITVDEAFKGQIFAYAVDALGNKAVALDSENDIVKDFYNESNDEFVKDISKKYDPSDYDTALDSDNYAYPNATIVENQEEHDARDEQHIVIVKPETQFTQNDGTELYANNVPLEITINDSYAGIREITWTVDSANDDENDFAGSLTVTNDGEIVFDNENEVNTDWVVNAEDQNLVTSIVGNLIVVNNSNDITVTITMKDRAGNVSKEVIVFGIDKTIPTIDVKYDNNNADSQYTDYYKDQRVATITITERNFRASDVLVKITNTDGVIPSTNFKSDVTWKTISNDDPDLTKHVAYVTYSADGDYTFKIEYSDNADNKAADFKLQKFTIDRTKPLVEITFDNNSARNGNYYKADRTATIVITEHNFDPARAIIVGTTSDTATYPAESKWVSLGGDRYSSTIKYDKDSKYSLDIEFKDKAGNVIDDVAPVEFYIDKTNPVLKIEGIVDQSANNTDGNIGFTVTGTDKNFESLVPTLTATTFVNGQYTTTPLTIGTTSNITNGKRYTVTNIETDGIYSITCTLTDKAGNNYSEVILVDSNGKTYTEKRSGSDKLVTFTVNRDGSVFDLSTKLEEYLTDYYIDEVDSDIVIYEFNADPISDRTITLNGKTLVENTDYTVEQAGGNGSWYEYTYTFKKTVFANEGEYNLIIYSKDKAENDSFSDIKDAAVKFVVDKTAPIVTVSGITTDGRYKTDAQLVTIVPTDDGGMIAEIIVQLIDEEGNVIGEPILTLTGEALEKALAEGISFKLTEDKDYQNIQIICKDKAGNVYGLADNEIIKNVTVSTSGFVIFWAYKPLRWGVISGIALLAALAVVLVVKKKKKK